MNLALSESFGQELRFAKRINSNEATKLKYDQTKFEFKYGLIQILKFQKHVWVGLLDRGDHNEEVGVGFVGFGQTSKKLWSFENQGLDCKINNYT